MDSDVVNSHITFNSHKIPFFQPDKGKVSFHLGPRTATSDEAQSLVGALKQIGEDEGQEDGKDEDDISGSPYGVAATRKRLTGSSENA